MSILAPEPMKRTALLLLLIACGGGAVVLGQEPATPSQRGRQGGAVQPGRQGAADQGRGGRGAQPTVRALPPAPNYLAIALEYLEKGEHLEPEFLQRVKARATRLSLV